MQSAPLNQRFTHWCFSNGFIPGLSGDVDVVKTKAFPLWLWFVWTYVNTQQSHSDAEENNQAEIAYKRRPLLNSICSPQRFVCIQPTQQPEQICAALMCWPATGRSLVKVDSTLMFCCLCAALFHRAFIAPLLHSLTHDFLHFSVFVWRPTPGKCVNLFKCRRGISFRFCYCHCHETVPQCKV